MEEAQAEAEAAEVAEVEAEAAEAVVVTMAVVGGGGAKEGSAGSLASRAYSGHGSSRLATSTQKPGHERTPRRVC